MPPNIKDAPAEAGNASGANFANFGLRFLEILSLEYAQAIVKSEILGILSGLLRTNDYETVT